jgi:type IV secretory pathway component VirB8
MVDLKSRFLKGEDDGRVDPVMRPAGSGEKDVLGAYPTSVRVPVLEGRRYLWTTRVFAIALFMSLAFNLMLVFTIFSMAPLKRVEPFLVTFNPATEQVVRIEPMQKTVAGFGLFLEQQAQEYVRMREEILLDTNEQQYRWLQYVRPRTAARDFEAYIEARRGVYKALVDKKIVRRVEIERVNRRPGGNFIDVYFSMNDFQQPNGNLLQSQKWIAQLTIDFLPQQVQANEQYLNPLGFTVVQYAIARQ